MLLGQMGTVANENWDKWAFTLTAIGEIGTWEMSTMAKISTWANKSLFAQVLICPKCPDAHFPRVHLLRCPFSQLSIRLKCPTAYFTRINLSQVPTRHGAHLTRAQLLICPKCPSTTPLEAATANILTQSGQRVGVRI